MNSRQTDSPDHAGGSFRQPLWNIIAAGITLTLASNVAAFVMMTTIVPRRQEGLRSVADVPWAPYVTIAHVLPFVFVYLFVCLWLKHMRDRVIVMATSAVTMYLWVSLSDAHLLWRDFIGKL